MYVDPESLNNSVRPKTNFMRVAQSLLEKGMKKEAIEMLDIYIKNFPDSKVPFDMYMVPYAEIYYKAGAVDKANQLVERVAVIYSQNLDYYNSFASSYRQYFEQDIQTAMGVIKRLSTVASENRQPKLASKMDALFSLKLKSLQ